jgi:hypothetical protein
VSTYRVAFDGKWQGKFDDRKDALQWAREVGETGRMTHVVAFPNPLVRLMLGPRLLAVFPDDQVEKGKWLWKIRWTQAGAGFGVPPV